MSVAVLLRIILLAERLVAVHAIRAASVRFLLLAHDLFSAVDAQALPQTNTTPSNASADLPLLQAKCHCSKLRAYSSCRPACCSYCSPAPCSSHSHDKPQTLSHSPNTPSCCVFSVSDSIHLVIHSRDLVTDPRDLGTHPRDLVTHPRDLVTHPRDLVTHPRDAVLCSLIPLTHFALLSLLFSFSLLNLPYLLPAVDFPLLYLHDSFFLICSSDFFLSFPRTS